MAKPIILCADSTCDLSPELIEKYKVHILPMHVNLEENSYLDGVDIVYGVRSSRKEDSFFKRFTAEAFYKFMKKMGADTVFNHADFRLMDRKALDAFAEFGEVNLYLRGIVTEIGLKTAVVTYERKTREKGTSKYPFRKMMELAETGITSFSVKPLKCAFLFAIIAGLLAGACLLCGFLALFLWKIPADVFFICSAVFALAFFSLNA